MKKILASLLILATLMVPAAATGVNISAPVGASTIIGYTPSGLTTAALKQKIADETDFSAMFKSVGYLAFIRH